MAKAKKIVSFQATVFSMVMKKYQIEYRIQHSFVPK